MSDPSLERQVGLEQDALRLIGLSPVGAAHQVAQALTAYGLDGQPLIGAVRDSFPTTRPYHGLHHCLLVALHAHAGARAAGQSVPVNFLLAGLFHDAGYHHATDDDQNIAVAVRVWGRAAFDHYRRAEHIGTHVHRFELMDRRDDVADLIAATRHPWTRDDPAACIMTDADILGSALDQEWCDRLTAETGVRATMEWARKRLRTDYGNNLAARRELHEETRPVALDQGGRGRKGPAGTAGRATP